ncbi:MAG TPA: tetratricopeptide repeat protein [Steroidobacteraceae bacterium]
MVDDYLSDREQEEMLRNWWRENWRWIVGGIVLALVGLFAYFQWQAYLDRRGIAASAQYDKVRTAAEERNLEQAQEALAALTKDYDSSPYAQQGRLLVAKLLVETGKFDEAAALLREVSKKSKDEELGIVAKLRLARVLVQQGKHDEAIALLDVDELGAFAAPAREIRGDAYLAKGDQNAARAEYAAALADPSAQIDRTLLEMKLQDLGGAPADAKAQGQP